MYTFNTPEWESSPNDNKSAKQLLNLPVYNKVSKKQRKIKNKKVLVTNNLSDIKCSKTKPKINNEVLQRISTKQKKSKVKKETSLRYDLSKPKEFTRKNTNLRIKDRNFTYSNSELKTKYKANENFKNEPMLFKHEKKIQKTNERAINTGKVIHKINKKKVARLKKRNKVNEDNVHINISGNRQNEISQINTTQRVVIKGNKKVEKNNNVSVKGKDGQKLQNKKNKLIALLSATPLPIMKQKKNPLSLRQKMIEKLKASRFRYLNEQLYNSESKEAYSFFKSDPNAFYTYHDGYKQQVLKWPLNPLDVVIKSIKKMPTNYIIADFGCGEANLAKSVPQQVHSFDLLSMNEYVIACDMAHVPLENDTVDVVVFCLSLMGTNIREYLYEANRVLKIGGKLKIAEVESRFDTSDVFIEGVTRFGFKNTWKDFTHNLFYFIDFEKVSKCKSLIKLPTISLYPCLYKKR